MVTAQNISTSNSISTTNNVTLQSRTATSNIPVNTTVSGGWMNLNTQHDNQAQGISFIVNSFGKSFSQKRC